MLVNELHQGGIRALMNYDLTIFDDMHVPEGYELNDIVDHILFKYGDAPLFSPDPETVKYYIERWSLRRLPLWERYIAAATAEYNPLENYDRSETRTENREHGGTVQTGDTGTVSDQGTHVTTDQRAADNSEAWANYDKRDETLGNVTTNNLNRLETRDLADDITETSRVHGNIGVTTSQQMLNSELDLIHRLDVIDYIADDWHAEFNLMIYV